jgi:hypothetical protein
VGIVRRVDSAWCGRGLSQVGLPGRGAGGRCCRCRSRRGVEAKPTAGRVSHLHRGRRLRYRPLRVDQRESVFETYPHTGHCYARWLRRSSSNERLGAHGGLLGFPTSVCAVCQSPTITFRIPLSVRRAMATMASRWTTPLGQRHARWLGRANSDERFGAWQALSDGQ